MPEGHGGQQQGERAPEAGEAAGASGTAAGGQGDPAGGEGQQNRRTFTADDVDRIVQERLARDRRGRMSDEEIEALRARAAKLDEIEEQGKTALQKAVEAKEAAEAARDQALRQASDRLVSAAILAEGTQQGALKPEHLHLLIDTGEVTVGDDGQVTGAKEAVEAFLKANPEYVGKPRAAGSADQGARGSSANGKGQLTSADLQGMSPEQIAQAESEGRLVDLMSGRQ